MLITQNLNSLSTASGVGSFQIYLYLPRVSFYFSDSLVGEGVDVNSKYYRKLFSSNGLLGYQRIDGENMKLRFSVEVRILQNTVIP